MVTRTHRDGEQKPQGDLGPAFESYPEVRYRLLSVDDFSVSNIFVAYRQGAKVSRLPLDQVVDFWRL